MMPSRCSAAVSILSTLLGLLGCQAFAAQQPGHADDAVHRRADLVAHVGEEGALGLVGRFGGQLRFGQRDFGASPHHDFPQVVADQLQLVDVGFVVVARLVADPHQHAHHAVLHQRHAEVADQVGMAARDSPAGSAWTGSRCARLAA
jgi:hypothetical protein